MKKTKYLLCAFIATLGFLLPVTATLYAQPNETLITAVEEAPEAIAAPENANSVPLEAPADTASDLKAEESDSAAEPTPAEQAAKDPIGTAGEVIDDVRAGDWRHAAAGLLVLLMLGLAKARDNTDWFSGDRAGAGLVLGLGFGGALIAALYSSAPLDWKLFVGVLSFVSSSVGIYTLAKKIISPSDKKDS